MDINDPVIKLCMEGAQAEFEGRIQDARKIYKQAWEASCNDYEACTSAHYVARYQENPEDTFRWNQEALKRADMNHDESVKEFHPSLYLNLGHSCEIPGNRTEAQRYYDLAAELGFVHSVEWQ